MECEVCKERSSVGYCVETNILICEVCSTSCEKCGDLMSRKAARVSERSGRAYCTRCWEEKHGKPKEKVAIPAPTKGGDSGGDTSFAALGTADADLDVSDRAALDAAEEADKDADDDAAFRASAWKPPPPWKLSFQSAILGLIAIVCVYIFPSFYRVTLPGGQIILTPYILMIVPTIAIIWGVLGLTSMDYMSDKTRSLLGVFIGALALTLCIAAVTRDPLDRSKEAQVETRDGYNRAELEVWRERMLEKHRPPTE